MAAGWPATAVVLLACAAPLLLWPVGARADGEAPLRDQNQQQQHWCMKKECKCIAGAELINNNGGQQQQVTVKCTFSGEQNVILEQNNNNGNLSQSLVALELTGDGHCNLTIYSKAFAVFSGLRSFNVTEFADVTIKRQGLNVKNVDSDLIVTISHVQRLYVDTNAIQPTFGKLDVLVEDCDTVRLGSEVVSKLRSFEFRRIANLELSNNTFKNAAMSTAIERITMENLSADKLPSHAFVTAIDVLLITNCKFGSIEAEAFPIYQMGYATLNNVTVDQMKSFAFQNSSLIKNLRIIECHIREMEKNAIMPVVTTLHIERTQFGHIQTSAVAVANNLTLSNNTFGRVASHGFVLHNWLSVRVYDNTFDQLDAEAFYEELGVKIQQLSELHMRDNEFRQPETAGGMVWPAVVLQKKKSEVTMNVTGNRFTGSCVCGPWPFVVVASNRGEDGDDGEEDVDDARFTSQNFCGMDPVRATCANLSAATGGYLRFGTFAAAAGCEVDFGEAFNRCVRDRAERFGVAANGNGGGGFRLFGNTFTPAAERGVITTVVLLILSGFAAVCAVSAVTWLNARGYFMKLRLVFTRNDEGDRGDIMDRTMSAHSLSPMSVHEYTELHRPKLVSGSSGGADDGGDGGVDLICGGGGVCVRVIAYQDKGTQTVPEELTHEMLQELRDKLDDPDDYAEARGMIEHLYDLIRVEETCCSASGSGGGGTWYSSGGVHLDDMTSTITTKAVTVGPGGRRDRLDVRSVGTGVPSLDRLWPPRICKTSRCTGTGTSTGTGTTASIGTSTLDRYYRRPMQKPPPPPPPSVSDYMDPADLLYSEVRDEGSYADIYCELADLRGGHGSVNEYRAVGRPPLPPVPDKPTEV